MYNVILQHLKYDLKPHKKELKTLYRDVYSASDSCHAIARVVHKQSFFRWSKADEDTLLNNYTRALHSVKTRADKKEMIRKLALLQGRSPMAVKIRLASVLKTQKQAVLAAIVKKAKRT
jgi:hypothetical protein